MVFGRLLRSSAPQDRYHDAKVEEPKAKWFKEEHGWETTKEFPSPADEDEAFLEPATAPSTLTPEEAISDDDWDWDMPGASRADEAVGALVVDDYLLVGESLPRSSAQPQEHASSGPEESTSGCKATPATLPPSDDSHNAIKEDSTSGPEQSTPGCSATSGTPAPADDAQAAVEVSTEKPVAEPHTADGAAGPKAEATQAGLTAASPDEQGQKQADKPGYGCLVCNHQIFKEEDILSSNYHAMTGPGYLTSAANNVCIALELQTQLYTTGKYTVREVSCSFCAAMLGVTYAGAADVRNRYKVGKFLIGRDRLRLPPGVVHPMDQK